MSEWSDLMDSLSDSCISQLGGQEVTYTPETGEDPFLVSGIFTQPAVEEERTPGNVLHFFSKISNFSTLSNGVTRKSLVEISDPPVGFPGGFYVVEDIRDDQAGGVVLILRKKS